MRLEQFEYLVAISKSHSLNEASKRLFVSQQSLGKAISNLEKELGVALIERGYNGCYLTKDGLEVLTVAQEIIERTEFLKDKYRSRSNETGRLVVLCCPSVHRTMLPAIIERFSQRMPFVEVVMVAKDSYLIPRAHVELIGQGDDAVMSVVNVPTINEQLDNMIKEADLAFAPLLNDHWVSCINRHHPLAHKANLTLRELLKEQLVIEYPGYPQPGVDQITLDYCSSHGVPSVKKIVDDEKLFYAAIDKNEFIGFASAYYVEHEKNLSQYRNIVIRNFTPAIHSRIGYLARVADLADARIQAFSACLEEGIDESL